MSPHESEEEINFYSLFVPFTTSKAVVWIFVIGIVVYFNMLFNAFVGDDNLYIVNYAPSHIIDISKSFGANYFNTVGQYRPIPAFYFSVLYSLFGTHTFFYHLQQLLMHIGSTILLFLFIRKFFSAGIAFILSVIFLVHPLQVESVSYISQTVSQIFFLSGMGALLLSTRKKVTSWTLSGIGILLLVSLLTKEAGILFIPIILTYNFLFERKNIPKLLFTCVLSVALYFFLRIVVGHVGFETRPLAPIATLPLLQRLLNIPLIVFYYLKSFLFPKDLAYDQQWVLTSMSVTSFYLPLCVEVMVLLLIGAVGILTFRKNKHYFGIYFLFLIWSFSGLFMIMQVYPLDATVADRWFYFPLAGFLGLIGTGLTTFKLKHELVKKKGVYIVVCIIVLFSVRTVVRNANWVDAITLFSHDLKVSENSNLDENLAMEYMYTHRYKEAMFYLHKSVDADPHSTTTLYDLGYAYEQVGDFEKAKYYYKLGLKQPDLANAGDDVKKYIYDGITKIMVMKGDPISAKPVVYEAIRKYPKNGTYWAYLAILEYKVGNQKEALDAAKKARTLLNNQTTKQLYNIIANKKALNLSYQ